MKVYVLTKARPDRQPTAEALMEAKVPFQWVLTSGDKTIDQYVGNFGRKPEQYLTLHVKNLMQKRQWLFSHAKEPILMLDDDLTFFARRKTGKFEKAGTRDIRRMVAWFAKVLKKHAHAGMVDKFMCTYQPRGVATCGRYNQVLGYNPKLALDTWKDQRMCHPVKANPKFDLELNQEHDMHMKLLALGLEPAISREFSKDGKYYAKGGLTGFRTAAKERKIFKVLKRRYPNFIKLRETPHSISKMAATFNWRKAKKAGLHA